MRSILLCCELTSLFGSDPEVLHLLWYDAEKAVNVYRPAGARDNVRGMDFV